MKNIIIFWHENSENKHAKKTDANHLSKQKYSVAKITDIRNGLLQFHEAGAGRKRIVREYGPDQDQSNPWFHHWCFPLPIPMIMRMVS